MNRFQYGGRWKPDQRDHIRERGILTPVTKGKAGHFSSLWSNHLHDKSLSIVGEPLFHLNKQRKKNDNKTCELDDMDLASTFKMKAISNIGLEGLFIHFVNT